MASFFRNTFDNILNNISSSITTPPRNANTTNTNRHTNSNHPNQRTSTTSSSNRPSASNQPNPASQASSGYFTRSQRNCPRHTAATGQPVSGHTNHHRQQQVNMNNTASNNQNVTAPKEADKVIEIQDLRDLCDIDKLTTKQLKTILIRNCVDYRGAIEKEELRAKARILWFDYNARREMRRASNKHRSHESLDDIEEKKLCKICMEREIDSVLLECGHMLSCVNCGKQLAECPICRQMVTRCVRTFQV